MKNYEAKTIEEALIQASTELNCPVEQLHYVIKDHKGTVDQNNVSVTIDVYTIDEVCTYGSNYLKSVINAMGIEVEVTSQVNEEGVIRLTINSERNAILIGHDGRTLRALNDLVRVVVSNHYLRRYRILLDVGDYKDKKYSKIISMARRAAKEVSRQHIDITLEPMTSDERRMIHNLFSDDTQIKTESIGSGEHRQVVIKYNGIEEHGFQSAPIYYRDIIGDRPRHGNRHNNHGNRNHNKEHRDYNNSSLNDLLHNSNSDFLKDDNAFASSDTPVDAPEENKMNEADKSIDDLPSASISSPLINTDALKEFEEKNDEQKDGTVSEPSNPDEQK